MSAPGTFRARCGLKRRVPERNLNSDEIREAKSKGYSRTFVAMVSEKRDRETGRRGRWEYALPSCGGFETTDRAAFDAHMLSEHGRELATHTRGYNETFSASIRRGWRSPRMSADGKPLPRVAAEATRECQTCGLIAEVSTNASDLWWTEHTHGCALAAQDVSA